MAGISGIIRHFDGIRGKVVQVRELVEVIDQMFDSFDRAGKISKTMLKSSKQEDHPDYFESK
ncbi:hypothetical protein ACTID9_11695 [Brevibacillus fluminis]|uniref:hypothetical protein n=1 Tax=Brevibacillus fluminis TaxID=511487 RepID=UPI003F8A7DC1